MLTFFKILFYFCTRCIKDLEYVNVYVLCLCVCVYLKEALINIGPDSISITVADLNVRQPDTQETHSAQVYA